MHQILLLGEKGLLGESIKQTLIKNNFNFLVINISKKHNIKSKQGLYKLLNNFTNRKKPILIINCIAALKPINFSDNYVNEKLPNDLLSYSLSRSSFLIHFSTTNVLIKKLNDKYTVQKEMSENLIFKNKNNNFLIMRLPLLLPLDSFEIGKIPRQFKILKKFINFPGFSFIPPSRNVYRPIDTQIIADKVIFYLRNKNELKKFNLLNFHGANRMNLKEISKLLLSKNLKRKNNLMINIPFPWKILDGLFIKYPNLQLIFQKNVFPQQFLCINR